MIWLEMLTVEVCKKYVIHPHFSPTLILGSFIFYEFFNPFLVSPQPTAAAAPSAPRTAGSSPGIAILTLAEAFRPPAGGEYNRRRVSIASLHPSLRQSMRGQGQWSSRSRLPMGHRGSSPDI